MKKFKKVFKKFCKNKYVKYFCYCFAPFVYALLLTFGIMILFEYSIPQFCSDFNLDVSSLDLTTKYIIVFYILLGASFLYFLCYISYNVFVSKKYKKNIKRGK